MSHTSVSRPVHVMIGTRSCKRYEGAITAAKGSIRLLADDQLISTILHVWRVSKRLIALMKERNWLVAGVKSNKNVTLPAKNSGLHFDMKYRLIAQKRIEIGIRNSGFISEARGRERLQKSSWSFDMIILNEEEYKMRTSNNALNAVELDIGLSGNSCSSCFSVGF